MLSKPSSDRIIALIREALQSKIAPALSGRDAEVALQAIDLMLDSLSRRVSREIHWMHEEIASIERLARSMLDEGIDPNDEIAASSDALDAVRVSSLRLDDMQRQYAAAGHVLTACAEVQMAREGRLRGDAEKILGERLAHETDILGDYHIVGKA